MTRSTPQNVSLLPIGKALSIFDGVVASTPRLKLDAAAARERLVAAAVDGFVETGVAKRILDDARPSESLIYPPNRGVARMMVLWDQLKTISHAAREEESVAWRRGLDKVVVGMMSAGLVAMRYVTHPRFAGSMRMTPNRITTMGILADALHDMPDFLARQNRAMSETDLEILRGDLSRAGRAIQAMRAW